MVTPTKVPVFIFLNETEAAPEATPYARHPRDNSGQEYSGAEAIALRRGLFVGYLWNSVEP